MQKEIQSILNKIKKTTDRGVKWEEKSSQGSIYIGNDYTIKQLVNDLEAIVEEPKELSDLRNVVKGLLQ